MASTGGSEPGPQPELDRRLVHQHAEATEGPAPAAAAAASQGVTAGW